MSLGRGTAPESAATPSGLRALPRTVWLIGLISLVNDSASEMLYPLVPLLLTGVLHAGPRALGLIEGLAEAAAALFKLLSGLVFDRNGRAKPWILAGYGVAGLARPLIALAGSWPMVLALRLADRLGKGLRSSPRDALLARSVGPGQRGLAFGIHRGMDNAGAVIGPLLAAALLSAGFGVREVFAFAWIPAVLVMVLALGLREAPRAPESTSEQRESAAPRGPDAAAAPSGRLDGQRDGLPAAFWRFMGVVALFLLGGSSNMFLLLRAQDFGVTGEQVPLLWALTALTASTLGPPLSAWTDRVGRVGVMRSGWVIYAAFYLLMSWSTLPAIVPWLLFAAYGVFMAATEGIEKALIADLVPRERLGRAYGWFNLVGGLMLLPASLLFGWLWQRVDVAAAFGFSAACAGLAAVLLPMSLGPGSRGPGPRGIAAVS